jgi:hypothetical protein
MTGNAARGINEGINTYLEANYDMGTHHFAPLHNPAAAGIFLGWRCAPGRISCH